MTRVKNELRFGLQMTCAATLIGMIGCAMTDDGGNASSMSSGSQDAAAKQPQPALEPFKQSVPTATTQIDMIAMPGGTVTLQTAEGENTVEVKPYWMAKTELPWEIYDVFVFAKDEEAGEAPSDADAYTRPSRPYVPPDRGYGHEGYATISVAQRGAVEFCNWLSAMTGRTYRLPTEAEWQLACEQSGITREQAGDYAWTDENADLTPHPVGAKKADANGLHDLWGNVREWVKRGEDDYVAAGGSFSDTLDEVGCNARHEFERDWQMTDPQIPKSVWWLSDAEFMGFRIVCEP